MFFIKTRCKSTIFLQTSKINYILFFFSKKEEKIILSFRITFVIKKIPIVYAKRKHSQSKARTLDSCQAR